MKHVKSVTRTLPVQAALWQEIVCQANQLLADLLSVKEAVGAPIITIIEQKCDLPENT